MSNWYLIYSLKHRAWWRENGHGYTTYVERAGRFSRQEAIETCGLARDGWDGTTPPTELAVSEHDVVAAIALHNDKS